MSLNWSARASSSSPDLTAIRLVSSPRPIRSAPSRNAWMGIIMRRARNIPASAASSSALSTSTAERLIEFVERRIGLLDRQLDENQPAQRRDPGMGRQHLAALHVGRFLEVVGFVRALRRLDLGQARHVGVAQDEADVGMRDEAALRADHIGVALLADLDLRDHVPNQLEVDLGDADPGVAARARDRERHVGLGLAAEIDRAVIDLLRDRFGELRVLRQIEPAADHVHGEARDAQLLLAGRIELRQLGYRGNLAQEAERVEAALLERARRPGQLHGPAELAFDLLDELADLRRGGFRLLALDADQIGLVLLVGEPDLEAAVCEQREADHGDEQADILAEQPSADAPPRRGGRHGDGARIVHAKDLVGFVLAWRTVNHAGAFPPRGGSPGEGCRPRGSSLRGPTMRALRWRRRASGRRRRSARGAARRRERCADLRARSC